MPASKITEVVKRVSNKGEVFLVFFTFYESGVSMAKCKLLVKDEKTADEFLKALTIGDDIEG